MRRQRVGFRNDGDQVDPRPEALHDLDVERFQRVARRPDKVQARVDAHVVLLSALRLLLLAHVGFVLVVLWRAGVDARVSSLSGHGKDDTSERKAHDEVDDRVPRVAVVDIVAKAGRVDHVQLDLELLLLEFGLDDVCREAVKGQDVPEWYIGGPA